VHPILTFLLFALITARVGKHFDDRFEHLVENLMRVQKQRETRNMAFVGAGGITRLKREESAEMLPSTRVAKITVYFEASEVAMFNQKRIIKRLMNEP